MIFNKKLKSLKYRRFRNPVKRIRKTRTGKELTNLTNELKKTPEVKLTPILPELKTEGD
ncbi:MAG: hypothetical protein K2H19_08785 [Ruminococcus sp.]|nr:hypothetical protein [Ruminococcus sp.]